MVYDDRHPLIGYMDKLTVWQIRERLREFPPTPGEIAELGKEESRRKNRHLEPIDRPEVYRLLAEYLRLWVPSER